MYGEILIAMIQIKTPHISSRPEADLLIASLGSQVDPNRKRSVKNLVLQVRDWESVVQTAFTHAVRPLLYRSLNGICPESVPKTVLSYLKRSYEHTLHRNLTLQSETLALERMFNSKGVEAVPYKGPLQASFVYGDLALREIADLDFLVQSNQFVPAKQLLLAHGYRTEEEHTQEKEKAISRGDLGGGYACDFVNEAKRIKLELHWRILPEHSSFGLDPGIVWNQLLPQRIDGTSDLSFSPEKLLLLLCIHNEKHNWRGLRYICDVAMIPESHPTMDWNKVMEMAQGLERTPSVLMTVYLAHILLGARIPSNILQKARAHTHIRMYAGLVRARLFRTGFTLPSFAEWFEYTKEFENLTEEREPSAFGKLLFFPHYVRAVLRPEIEDRQRFPELPKWLSWLYLITRVMRFIKYHAVIAPGLAKARAERSPPPLLGSDPSVSCHEATDGQRDPSSES